MNELNPQQQEVVQHTTGPALVIAGAGSGKTLVITRRVAELVKQGVAPAQIMMVTFTNKAAEEMKHRVGAVLQAHSQQGEIVSGTFHSLANRFLRRYAAMVGFSNNFTILDQSDSRDLLKAVMADVVPKNMGEGKRFPAAAVVQSAISMAFNRDMPLETYLRNEAPWLLEFLPLLEDIARQYTERKKTNNGMDFDDLLLFWHQLLANHPQLELSRQLQYVMVDEYQDTNRIQAEILDLLTTPANGEENTQRNLMVVGDDAQAIYGWRGASFENILEFPQRYGAKAYRLEHNYRSTPDVLEVANASIAHNEQQFEKHLKTVRHRLAKPQVAHFWDMYQEADWVVDFLMEHSDQDVPLSEMAVLYRNHAQSAILQMRLAERGVPFQVRSGIKFFEQAHVKDSLAFLKVIFNPLDEIAWFRLLKMLPGVGNKSAMKIFRVFQQQRAVRLSKDNVELQKAIPKKALVAWQEMAQTFALLVEDGVTPSQMVERVRLGFYQEYMYTQFENPREREQDLVYLAQFAERFRSLERFLGQLALVGSTVLKDEEEAEEPGEQLTLSTIHQAKGLEWDVVAVVGLADGRFPHAKCLHPPERLEEERRLFYVGVTRCKRHLALTVPLMAVTNGMREVCRPSRFVEELPPDLVEKIKAEGLEGLGVHMGDSPGFTVDY